MKVILLAVGLIGLSSCGYIKDELRGEPGNDGETVRGPKGDSLEGPPGEPGANGNDGKDGSDGQDGTLCSVERVDNGAIIICGDQSVLVEDGTTTVIHVGKDKDK